MLIAAIVGVKKWALLLRFLGFYYCKWLMWSFFMKYIHVCLNSSMLYNCFFAYHLFFVFFPFLFPLLSCTYSCVFGSLNFLFVFAFFYITWKSFTVKSNPDSFSDFRGDALETCMGYNHLCYNWCLLSCLHTTLYQMSSLIKTI